MRCQSSGLTVPNRLRHIMICDRHDLRSLAAYCFSDLAPPFLAGAKLVSLLQPTAESIPDALLFPM